MSAPADKIAELRSRLGTLDLMRAANPLGSLINPDYDRAFSERRAVLVKAIDDEEARLNPPPPPDPPPVAKDEDAPQEQTYDQRLDAHRIELNRIQREMDLFAAGFEAGAHQKAG